MNITVNAMGKSCPIPVVETKKTIEAMTESGVVSVHVDNETAVENLKRLAQNVGRLQSVEKKNEVHFIVNIEAERMAGADDAGDVPCADCAEAEGSKPAALSHSEHLLAVFDSASMGTGSEELGKILIKGFVYAMRELPKLPDACLFYNGGAFLTSEDSECLEDLKAMEADGVKILTCGTCAKFFGIDEKLAVGELTNMYDIVERMSKADKVIRP